MSYNVHSFNVDEVRYLISYTESLVFEVEKFINKSEREESFEEISLRTLRKWGKLLAYPELILEERPIEDEDSGSGGLNIRQRELLFQILGNRSPEIVSLNDVELIESTLRQLKTY